jgi:hypothetical protein
MASSTFINVFAFYAIYEAIHTADVWFTVEG